MNLLKLYSLNSQPQLKITGLKRLPPEYRGEPCIISFEIVDIQGGVYESECHMDAGFNPNSLRDAAYHSFNMCDTTPVSVNIKSFRIKK